jgi:hypothetical protein
MLSSPVVIRRLVVDLSVFVFISSITLDPLADGMVVREEYRVLAALIWGNPRFEDAVDDTGGEEEGEGEGEGEWDEEEDKEDGADKRKGGTKERR